MSDDINLAVLRGRLATAPDVMLFDSGSQRVRFLVTVYTEDPVRRIDVVPVTLHDPPQDLLGDLPGAGARVWIAGSLRRRSNNGPEGRRSRVEVSAHRVEVLGADRSQAGPR